MSKTKTELYRIFELARLVYEGDKPAPAPQAAEAAEAPEAKPEDAGTPEEAKEAGDAAIDHNLVQVEAYAGLSPERQTTSAEGTEVEQTDLIAGGKVRYVPNTEGPVNIAYTVGGEFVSRTGISAPPGAEVSTSSSGNDIQSSGGGAEVRDTSEFKGTAGVEAVVPTGPVDLFLGVGIAGGMETTDYVGVTPEGESYVTTSSGAIFEASAQAGARVNIGPAFVGVAGGITQGLTDTDQRDVRGTGSLGVSF